MLYNPVLQEPAAELLRFAPCRGLALLDQPVHELRRHKGPLVLDSFLFPGLQKGVFRTHQPGVVGGKIGGENGSSEKQFQIYSGKSHLYQANAYEASTDLLNLSSSYQSTYEVNENCLVNKFRLYIPV